jgi:beta-phosphoglucomutase
MEFEVRMTNIKAVLFDMDGVLVNSEPVITEAAIQALKEFGVHADYTDFHTFTGMGEDRFIGGVAEKYGQPFRLEMKDRAYEIYQQIIPGLIEVYPGTVKLLETLKHMGIPTALASSADTVKVTANLKAASIPEDLFHTIISGNDVVNKKPSPDIYLLAAKRCGKAPADCVVIEDAISGIQAAKAAGMRCIAVMTSFDEKKLLTEGANAVCTDISGVLECLERL